MPETVKLRKATGGATITVPGPGGEELHWDKDGDVTEVPYDFAMDLLKIPGAGFSVVDDEPKGKGTDSDGKEVTEPAPKADVREPAPLKSKDASPTTAKPRGSTVKRS